MSKNCPLKTILTILLIAILVLLVAPNAFAADPEDPFKGDTPSDQELTPLEAIVGIAGLVEQVDPATIPCDNLADFEDVSPGNYDGILVSGGLKLAERFAGQTLSYSGDYDVLSGSPSSPLILQIGAPNRNIQVSAYSGSYGNVVDGLGPVGYPSVSAIGEGSFAVLFPSLQSRFKFTILGAEGGTATLNFFRADGSSLGTIVIIPTNQVYGFGHSGGLHEIAGFSIHNDEYGGFGVDDICYEEITIADFSADPTTGIAPLTVDFTDKSDGVTTSWSWDFGDSGISTDQSPTHIYSLPGTYNVSLTVTGPSGTDTETKENYITVNPANLCPIAVIDYIQPDPAIEGQGVSFGGHGTDPDGCITGYNWRSSIDGNLSDQECCETRDLSVGTHAIYFKVKDDDGVWSEEVSQSLEVTPSHSLKFKRNDFVMVGDLDLTGNFTIELWMKVDSKRGWDSVVMKKWDYGIEIDPDGNLCASIYNGRTWDAYIHYPGLNTGRWHHVAMVWDEAGNDLYLYVDGLLVGSKINLRNHRSNNKPLLMGAWTTGSEFFNGIIDEVRISNIVRYTSNFAPSTTPFTIDSGTVALWHLDEGTGQIVTDASGSGWNGTLGPTTAIQYSDPTWSTENPFTSLNNPVVATFGLNNGNSTWDESPNILDVMRFQNTAGTGILTKLELMFDDISPNGKVRMGVYTDNDGNPGSLLLDVGEVQVTNGWVSIDGLSFWIIGNNHYWLAFNMQNSNDVRYQTGMTWRSHRWANVTYGSFPTQYPVLSSGYNNNQYIMRASVTVN